MSWFGYKAPTTSDSSEPKVSPRTAKRNKLQEDRLQRAKQRNKLKQQLKAVQEAKEEADRKNCEMDLPPIVSSDTDTTSDDD